MFLYSQEEGNNMNLIFKKIWSRSLGCVVVVSENAKSEVKTNKTGGIVETNTFFNEFGFFSTQNKLRLKSNNF